MLHAEMKAWDALNLSLQSPGLPSSLVDLKGTYWWLLYRRAGFCSSSRKEEGRKELRSPSDLLGSAQPGTSLGRNVKQQLCPF